MKNSEILELSKEDIVARIAEEKVALNKLKFAHAVSAIENPLRIKAARKLIARLNTALSAIQKAEAKAAEQAEETAAEA